MAGFDNDVVYGVNVDFSGAGGGIGGNATMLTNGQLLIGTSAVNAGNTHINVGTLTSPDASINIGYSSPNITLQLPSGGQALETLSDDVGTIVIPSAGNNIQLVGHVVEQGATKFSTVVAGVSLLNLNPMSASRWIVDKLGFNGTHTTIAAAITAATSGDTIFLLPGTYTENLTLKVGVNLTAYDTDSSQNGTGNVIINGTCTLSTAGTVSISGIQLQTNSANSVVVSGSAASILNLFNCNLNCTNNTGISYSSSNAASAVNIFSCFGNLGTTGIAFFSNSSAGTMMINNSQFLNTGSSLTASTASAGLVEITFSSFSSVFSTSGTAIMSFFASIVNEPALNTITFTSAGTGSGVCSNSYFASGTASGISIGAGTTVTINNCIITCTNTNAITGAGTIIYSNLAFPNTSTTINTTTQSFSGTIQGSKNTAPSAGFLGENINSNASAVSLSNATPKTITSISLTAGVWDVSGYAFFSNTGAFTTLSLGINTSTNVLPAGNAGTSTGPANYQPGSVQVLGGTTLTLPPVRSTLSTTTSLFLVGSDTFSSGTCAANGYITATRVG